MIKRLSIDNFKCIQKLDLDCTNLNLFIGTNSSGKSTILQGLLFFAQNVNNAQGLNGDFVSLGQFEENRCFYLRKNEISVSVTDMNDHVMNKEILMVDNQLKLGTSTVPDEERFFQDSFDVQKKKIQYLSCHRLGPQNVYQKDMSLFDMIGVDGQYAIAYLNAHAYDLVDQGLCQYKGDYTFLGQVNWWLNYIVNAEIKTIKIPGTDYVQASYSMYDINEIRPQNIGSGVSYLVSVIITCLASPLDSVIVIENPEIHLHPSAQSKVSEFLYFISKQNRQLFLESHSDHIFNGFRAGIAKGEMEKEHINIYFVSQNDSHNTEAMLVDIGRMGRIENPRKDLFDQFDIDMNRMIGV